MFERFSTLEEVFSFKLGSALTMEHDSLEMLGELAATTQRPVRDRFCQAHRATGSPSTSPSQTPPNASRGI